MDDSECVSVCLFVIRIKDNRHKQVGNNTLKRNVTEWLNAEERQELHSQS